MRLIGDDSRPQRLALAGGLGAWPVVVRRGFLVEERRLVRTTPLIVRAPHMRKGRDAYRIAWAARGRDGIILPFRVDARFDKRKLKLLDQYIGDLGIDRGNIAPPVCWDEELYESLWCLTTIIITSGTTETIPSDWNNASNDIHCIGHGSHGGTGSSLTGGGGGGSGAWAHVSNSTQSGTVNIQVSPQSNGTADTQGTFFNGTDTLNSSCGANGGNIGFPAGTAGAGGNLDGTGATTGGAAGGAGGSNKGGGGGGGAPGPNSAGSVGGAGAATTGGNGGNGGSGGGGTGGAGATTSTSAQAGTNGTDITSAGGGAGSGGGGGGGSLTVGDTSGANGGSYGAGGGGGYNGSAGGLGTQGVIVLKYTPLFGGGGYSINSPRYSYLRI